MGIEQPGGAKTPRNKILIHGMNFFPEPIGVGRYTGELAAYLAAQGEAVEVITSVPHYPGWKVRPPYRAGRYRVEAWSGVRIVRCPLLLDAHGQGIWRLITPLTFALAAAPVAIWRILRSRPDAVVCVQPTLMCAPAAVLAARIVGARCILHVQDLEIDAAFSVGHLKGEWLRKVATAVERFMLRRFDSIITISERMRRAIEVKGIAPDVLLVLRNWVDLSSIRRMDGANRFREMLGIAATDFVVLYAGQLGPKQALPVLLDAALQCRDHSGIRFVIAGDGPIKESLVETYGRFANIHFLPLQPEEHLCELLNVADLHVLPQDRSAADLVLPSKLGGMLASGRPILVTADAGTELHDLLDGVAIVVPAHDVHALSEAIKQASLQRPAPSPRTAELLEMFSSRNVLPAFHRAICASPRRARRPIQSGTRRSG